MRSVPIEPGTPVHVDYRKWTGSPHWQNDSVFLGTDEHGSWLGAPSGTHFERPGASFEVSTDLVTLIPTAGFTPTFYDQHEAHLVRVYVDITTPPQWSQDAGGRWRVTMIDLDLDVVERASGVIYVDDEDEFLDHQAHFGYPADVVARAEGDAREVFDALRDRRGPFDGVAETWLRKVVD